MLKYALNWLNTVLLPQFQPWTDEFGLMQDNGDQNSTGNGVLFTGHYVFGLVANDLLTEEEKERILAVWENCMRERGLVCRLPGANGWYEAHDDLVGIMGGEAAMEKDRSKRRLTKMIYDYGKYTKINGIDPTEPDPKKQAMHKWLYPLLNILTLGHIKYVWNNVNPGTFHVSSWLGRRMEVIATMQMVTSKWFVNPFYWLYWAVTMLKFCYFPDKTYHDGYTLRFHSALACHGFGPVTNWICKKVRQRVAKDFGDFGQLLAKYFGKPEHPIVELCKGKY